MRNSFNNSDESGILRTARAIVTINGINVKWFDIEITTTTFYLADNYQFDMPLQEQDEQITLEYLFSTQKMEVKIYLGFPIDPNQYTTTDLDLMIVGDIDRMVVDPLTQVATFMGRDLTSRLIDTKTYAKYSNKTSSEIATILANKNGLTPVVTQTTELVGVFYAYENTLLTKETTEWDLICFLAQQSDFVVYVEGDKLIFKPRPTTSSDPYILDYTPSNFLNASPVFRGTNLTFERSMTLAKDVVVKIRIPYDSYSGTASTVKVQSKHAHAHDPELQTYVYTMPGLSKQQALVRANQIIRDITLHEIKISTTIPADTVLRKDSLIKIRGASQSLDQFYFTDEVVRRISINEYTMTVSAKNHSVDSQIVL